ncbi:hypothetical protein CBFG_00531 [Clostridiales bacterium 1_7_47FAA]|nr:hypothetical protein CBFG_00531 [Clostridiales bacterium 1_7_47FAA]
MVISVECKDAKISIIIAPEKVDVHKKQRKKQRISNCSCSQAAYLL